MYFPPPWHNLEFHGSTRPGDLETAATWRPDQWERVTYPEPEEICEDGADEDYWCSSYMIDGAQYDWNTNYTFIPGEPTLPMEFCYGSGRIFNAIHNLRIVCMIFQKLKKLVHGSNAMPRNVC